MMTLLKTSEKGEIGRGALFINLMRITMTKMMMMTRAMMMTRVMLTIMVTLKKGWHRFD